MISNPNIWAILSLILSIILFVLLVAFIKWLLRRCQLNASVRKNRGRVHYNKDTAISLLPFHGAMDCHRCQDVMTNHVIDPVYRKYQNPLILPPMYPYEIYGRESVNVRDRIEELPMTSATNTLQRTPIPMMMTGMSHHRPTTLSLSSDNVQDQKLRLATEKLQQSASETQTNM